VSTYRVYYIDANDRIFHGRYFDAIDDNAAIAMAEQLCEEKPPCVAVEVWDGSRRVFRHNRATPQPKASA
jgi:hypothetical protein